MRDAKKRLLEPGFLPVPFSAEVWVQSYESYELQSMSRLAGDDDNFQVPTSGSWAYCPGAAAPASMQVRPPRWGGVGFRPLSVPARVFHFDFTNLPESSGQRHEVSMSANASGTVHALVCWWRCFMDESQTIALSTAPSEAPSVPSRDHWRQSVYMLPRPAPVEAGDLLTTIACHDDFMIWFDGVSRDHGKSGVSEASDASASNMRPGQKKGSGRNGVAEAAAAAAAASERASGREATGMSSGATATAEGALATSVSGPPPVCLCGLHRAWPPARIWMLNHKERTESFRRAIRQILSKQSDKNITPVLDESEDCGIPRKAIVSVVSDGFLLPLIAAQEGASDVLTIPSFSATAGAVCRDVYTANCSTDKIKAFPGGVTSIYHLLSLSQGSSDHFAAAGTKLDAVVGEPYFDDMAHSWPMEGLLLFWCVRTALESRGYFSPRTRVVPARARLLACPIECDWLFRARRSVRSVEGVDMSAVNDILGYCERESGGAPEAVESGPGITHEAVAERERRNKSSLQPDGDDDFREDIVSVRLSEYPQVCLAPSIVVLDMDLTRGLCDLRGGRTEIRCGGSGCHRSQEMALSERSTSLYSAEGEKTLGGGISACHGVALWLELWLDEEGQERLSTGPDVGFWAQGLVLFQEPWSVPHAGRSFHLEALLKDGALRVELS